MLQNHLSRLWFLSKGCKQVPPDFIGGKILWAHPDGYFLNAQGQKVPDDNRNPSSINPTWKSHGCYPKDRATNKLMHHLMALTYYGDRPIFTDKNGKTYVGICHHLIPDRLDYRPANLLCWLTREQHTEADRRQSALRKVLPDLHEIGYDCLRQLQDPRVTSKEDFEKILCSFQVNNIDRSKSVNDHAIHA